MAFDKNRFMSMTTAEALETRSEPLPEGDWKALYEKVDCRPTKKDPNAEHGYNIVLTFKFVDDEMRREAGYDDDTDIRRDEYIYVELGPDGGMATGKNKNTRLGKIRDAVGQNEPGQAWSPEMLAGQGPVIVRIGRRTDPDTDEVYDDIKRVIGL